MSGGKANRGGEDEQGLNGMSDGCPTGAGRGARRGQTGCPTGPDGGPDRSHVIGHVIFECHVTRLRWQMVILLPTLLSQR
jgi:hypothetical protein